MNPRMRSLLLREWRGDALPDEEALPSADLREVFQRVFTRMGLAERLREVTLTEAWPDLVGPALAAHCHPRSVRRGVLHVTVEHSAWLHQITLVHKKDILRELQQHFPQLKIKDLALRIG